jgi:polyhydroxyalkanoate synthesis regulator phasin
MYYAHFRLVHSGVPGDLEEDVMNKQKIFVPAVVAAVLLLGITVGVVFGGPLIASAYSNATGTSATATPTTPTTPTTPATATTTNPYCEQYLKDLANRLHVSVATLQQAQLAAHEDVLAQLVRDGKLTQKQADAIKQRLASHPECAGNGNGMEMHLVRYFLQKYIPDLTNEVALGLHLSADQLQAELKAGKSLNDIAAAQHVSSSQLQTIETNALQSTLNKAVAAGDLTQQQANQFMQYAQNHPEVVDRLLSHHFKGKQ